MQRYVGLPFFDFAQTPRQTTMVVTHPEMVIHGMISVNPRMSHVLLSDLEQIWMYFRWCQIQSSMEVDAEVEEMVEMAVEVAVEIAGIVPY